MKYKFDMEEFLKFEGILIGKEIPYKRIDEPEMQHLRFELGLVKWDVAIGYGTHGADEGLVEAFDFNSEEESTGLTAVECLEWVEEYSFEIGDGYDDPL